MARRIWMSAFWGVKKRRGERMCTRDVRSPPRDGGNPSDGTETRDDERRERATTRERYDDVGRTIQELDKRISFLNVIGATEPLDAVLRRANVVFFISPRRVERVRRTASSSVAISDVQ